MTTEASYAPPLIRSDVGKLIGAVMVRPTAAVDRLTPIYGESSPIAERALEQYGVLVKRLAGYGIKTHVLEPDFEVPPAALVADCAVVVGSGAILLRPSSTEQRRIVPLVERTFEQLNIPIVGRIEAPGILDGADVVLGPHVAYVGVPHNPSLAQQRSNQLGRRQFETLAQTHGFRAVELSLAPDVVRLRNVFSFVAPDCVLAASEKVDLVAVKDAQIVEIPRGEEYACGVLILAPRFVLANLRFRTALPLMKKAKIGIEAIDLWEFGKAGVAPCSLALPLKRV